MRIFLNKKYTNTLLRLASGGLKFLFHIACAQILGFEAYGIFMHEFAILNVLILILGFELYTVISHKISKNEWSLIDSIKHETLFLLFVICPVLIFFQFFIPIISFYSFCWVISEILIRNGLRYLIADDNQLESSALTLIQSATILLGSYLILNETNIWSLLFVSNMVILCLMIPAYLYKTKNSKVPLSIWNILNKSVLVSSLKMSFVGGVNRVFLYCDKIFFIKFLPPEIFGQIAFFGSLLSSLNMIIDPLIYQIRLPHYIRNEISTIKKDFLHIVIIVILGTFAVFGIFNLKYDFTGGLYLIIIMVIIYSQIFINNFLQFILYTQGNYSSLMISSAPVVLLLITFIPFVGFEMTLGVLMFTQMFSILLKYVYIKKTKVFL